MSEEPLLLAIETARLQWSLSLLKGPEEISRRAGNDSAASSEMLTRNISALLEENRASLKNLNAIAVSRGPGSFTGIRVGLATARALAFGAKINCFGITLFEALTLQSPVEAEDEKLLTVLSAGQNQIYWQSFSFADGQWSDDFPPRLDEPTIFAAEVNKRRRDGWRLKILADSDSSRRLETIKILGAPAIVQIESDNVSKCVGLKCREIMSKSSRSGSSQNDLTPLYLREIRIGK